MYSDSTAWFAPGFRDRAVQMIGVRWSVRGQISVGGAYKEYFGVLWNCLALSFVSHRGTVCVRARVRYTVCDLGGGSPAHTHRHPRNITYMPTSPNPTIYPQHQNTQPPSTHTPTQHDPVISPRSATHRRPCSQSLACASYHTIARTDKPGSPSSPDWQEWCPEIIASEVPNATARGASVVVVWCTAMIHACLGC